MSSGKISLALVGLFAVMALANTGCTTQGPYLGFVAFPIPLSPYFQNKAEDEAWFKERYGRVPVLGPLAADTADVGLDEPSDDEILRKLKHEYAPLMTGHESIFDEIEGGFILGTITETNAQQRFIKLVQKCRQQDQDERVRRDREQRASEIKEIMKRTETTDLFAKLNLDQHQQLKYANLRADLDNLAGLEPLKAAVHPRHHNC